VYLSGHGLSSSGAPYEYPHSLSAQVAHARLHLPLLLLVVSSLFNLKRYN